MRSRTAVALCFVMAGACSKPSAQQPQPSFAEPNEGNAAASVASSTSNRVFNPTFLVGNEPLSAGTAFVIQSARGAHVLITAHHLFGPAGGLERDLSWQELPQRVRSVEAISIDDESVKVTGGAPIAVEGAEAVSAQHVGGDLAIFPISKLGMAHVLTLAAAPPKVGDRVALLAQVEGVRETRHEATVLEVGNDYIAYKFDAKLELRGTSGAPVVDSADHVVAINLSGGELDGSVVGVGNSIASFGPAITHALKE